LTFERTFIYRIVSYRTVFTRDLAFTLPGDKVKQDSKHIWQNGHDEKRADPFDGCDSERSVKEVGMVVIINLRRSPC